MVHRYLPSRVSRSTIACHPFFYVPFLFFSYLLHRFDDSSSLSSFSFRFLVSLLRRVSFAPPSHFPVIFASDIILSSYFPTSSHVYFLQFPFCPLLLFQLPSSPPSASWFYSSSLSFPSVLLVFVLYFPMAVIPFFCFLFCLQPNLLILSLI